ncbi:U-box domain-containing protein [Cardiosporidium cionae]|uniref:U-box domain-containing protein n=1 Tax=Cardiosporidium cionae TaxID=476202 RepID=A0ABQ7J8S9_9APIC|nr:U-box domain-containing protein [Cardiosporidium cionae]|eukprot:KAF8820400.1 U-box domain-containing protein [Cardiosporidium cionae]
MEKPVVQEFLSTKVHAALRYILKAALQKSEIQSESSGIVHLANLEEEFRLRQSGNPKMCIDDLGLLIMERIKLMRENAFIEGLPYFLESYRRCMRQDAVGSTFPKIIVEAIPKIKQELINYASLLVICPEIYEIEGNETQKSKMLFTFLQKGVNAAFFNKLIDCLEENQSNVSMELFSPVVGLINEESSQETFKSYSGAPLKALTLLVNNKRTAKAVVLHPSFLLLAALPSTWEFSHSRVGMQLQLHSLIGRLFSLTPIDAGNTWPEKERFSTSLFSSPTILRDYLHSTFQTHRASLNRIIEGTAELLKTLCISTGEHRDRIVLLFGMLLNSNHRRATLGHRSSMRQTPETFDTTYHFLLRSEQENTFGVYLNAFWTLLLLTEPIKLEKLERINYFFPMQNDSTSTFLLGNITKLAKLGDEEAVAAAVEFRKKNEEARKSPNFSTQIFWLTFRGLAIFFNPAMTEFKKVINQLSSSEESQHSQPPNPSHIKTRGEIFTWELVLLNPRFINVFVHFLHLLFTFLLRAIYFFTNDGISTEKMETRFDATRAKLLSLVYNNCTSSTAFLGEGSCPVSPQFAVLPAQFVDDLLETLQNIITLHRISKSLNTNEMDPLKAIDCELMSAFCFTLMMNPNSFRNVHSRCDGARLLAALYTEGALNNYFASSSPLRRVFISACTFSFIDSQKANFYYRLQFRLPIVEVFLKILVEEEDRKHFNALIKEQPDMYVHLIHLLLNDVSDLVEDAMNSLSEIRKRELSSSTSSHEVLGGTTEATRVEAPQRNPQNDVEEIEEDEESDDDEPPEDSPFTTLQQKTRQVVTLGYQTCLLLWNFTKYFGESIVEKTALVPHMITCLDCCLDHLVGPKCLQLKVRNFDEYNFNPKLWLSKVCETYVYLVMADKAADGETIFREIIQDGRFFQLSTFKKAHRVLRREGLISFSLLKQFNALLSSLFQLQNEDQIDEDDIPDEYLDPIMQEIMMDPVKLPSSNVVMDRKHIERHLMSDSSDPFNRLPLKKEDLVTASKLKNEILSYIASKRGNKKSN